MDSPAELIPGYDYGSPIVPRSIVSLAELESLKVSANFTQVDRDYLNLAGEILSPQTQQIVAHWRAGIIASIPHLARHSRSPNNQPLPDYLARSNHRFQQWIMDTCQRDYDQAWLDYQMEIAARHTVLKKNQIDDVQSTPFVPLSDIVAFTAVMNQTIKPYLAAAGHSPQVVDNMHTAWCKSLQIQIALWSKLYMGLSDSTSFW